VGQELAIHYFSRVGNHPLSSGLPWNAKNADVLNLSKT
jgi:hypothetical protein